MDQTKVAEELQGVVPGRVVANVKSYLRDAWPLLSISTEEEGSTPAAVRPLNLDEVARVVKYAAGGGLRVLCRGGGTSLTGASVPHGEIVLDLGGLNQVLDVDETNRTVSVQAGMRLGDLEPRLAARGFTLGQFPKSFETATVGGYVSTMGAGQYAMKYGAVEDSVIRLQVILPDGEVVWTRSRGTPRSSVGPDLARLFIGAEGAFGIVVAAELKLHKVLNHVWKAAYTFEDFTSALSSARSLLDLDVPPTVCRVYNEVDANLHFGRPKPLLILMYTFASSTVMSATVAEAGEAIGPGAGPGEPALVDRWFERRFAYREEEAAISASGHLLDTAEIACNWSAVIETYVDVMSTLTGIMGVSAVGATVSHLYHQGACTCFTLILKPDARLYWDVWNSLSQVAERHGATLSHHHGVGVLKAGLVRKEYPRELQRMLKSGIDPKGTLGQHRV